MRFATRSVAAGGLVVALAVVTGCTGATTNTPTTTALVTLTVRPSVVDLSGGAPSASASPDSPLTPASEPPTGTSASDPSDPSSQEATDRAKVEATWAAFWTVSSTLWKLPDQDRLAAMSELAVDPTLSESLDQARDFIAAGVDTFGEPSFHPYWNQSIDGSDLAVMGDCMDTSQTGSVYKSTGETRTKGVSQNNTTATFVRGGDKKWRVEKIVYLVDIPCP